MPGQKAKNRPAQLVHENLDEEQLRRNLALSDTERFYKMMRLIRIHLMLKNARIEHKDII